MENKNGNEFLVLFDDGEHWVRMPYSGVFEARRELKEWGAVIELTGSAACPTRTIMPATIIKCRQ